jgi:hypothetical protein
MPWNSALKVAHRVNGRVHDSGRGGKDTYLAHPSLPAPVDSALYFSGNALCLGGGPTN